MERLETTRILFQLLAFGIFLFQLQNSITKYVNKPIVQQTSIKSLSEIDKPLIYVCQNGQFNNTKSKLMQKIKMRKEIYKGEKRQGCRER